MKNNTGKAKTLAGKIASGAEISLDVNESVSYSNSPAIHELTSCLSDATAIVKQLGANLSNDAMNVLKISNAIVTADKKTKEVVTNGK